jgi:hypothetical protein
LPVGQGGFDAGDIGSGVTYSPTISGGSGTNDLTWNVSPSGDAVSGTCGSNTNCTALPPDNHYCSLTDLSLHVADHDAATSQCPAVDSEHEQVTKTTSVSATNH